MSSQASPVTSPSTSEIRAHLAEILESPQFRSSKRCRSLITFLIETTIEGRQDILKERVIGVEVFDRPTDYNPATDPIVRVSAAEVRKRLAQYYEENAPGDGAFRIRVATGHYIPEFSRAEVQMGEPLLVEHQPPTRPWARWAAMVAVPMLLASVWMLTRPASAFDRFWGPAFHSRRAALLLTETYGPGSIRHRFHAETSRSGGEALPSMRLLESDVTATLGQTLMLGNVLALRSFDRLFSSRGLEAELRIGGEVSMAELAERPVILIGYFNNPWAKNVNNEKTRFTLATERRGDLFVHAIHDSHDRDREWIITSDRPWFENTPVSYAIVTRVYDRHSGRFLVSLAGMTHLATSAAAEFVTRSSFMEELQRRAPAGWDKMNIQVVLQTNIVNQTAAPPALLAAHFW